MPITRYFMGPISTRPRNRSCRRSLKVFGRAGMQFVPCRDISMGYFEDAIAHDVDNPVTQFMSKPLFDTGFGILSIAVALLLCLVY